MAEFGETVRVHGSPAEVARVLRAVERWPSWNRSVSRAERTASGPVTVGEVILLKQHRLPSARWTVTEADEAGFTWKSSSPGVRNTGEHWTRDNGDGTSTVRLVLRMEGPLSGLAAGLLGGLIRRYVRMEAEGLKRAVEHA